MALVQRESGERLLGSRDNRRAYEKDAEVGKLTLIAAAYIVRKFWR